MRVYNRKDFLSLPEGTFFCKGTQWSFDNLSIKGQTLDNDFVYVDLCNIDSNGTDCWVERLEDSLNNGTSYPINNNSSRDGFFDENAIFLIFEKHDLIYLINLMKISIVKMDS